MNHEKNDIRSILRFCLKKGLCARAASKKINDIEGQGFISKSQSVKWIGGFRDGYIRFKGKSRFGRSRTLIDDVL